MASRHTRLPKKLKHDSILEALLELRFEPTSVLSEILIAKIIQDWPGVQSRRLPAYELPPQVRELDPNARFAPTIELGMPDRQAALRVGPYVVSFHKTAPYSGWDEFRPLLAKVVQSLFSATNNQLTISRVGLRYINALTEKHHGVDLRRNVSRDLHRKLSHPVWG